MNPRERFLAALKGEMPDHLPLTIWNNKLPGGKTNEEIFGLGVLLIIKSTVWQQGLKDIEIQTDDIPAPDGNTYRLVTFRTPNGVLTEKQRIMPGTVWIEKHLFESPNDYEALEALISAREYSPDFSRFLRDDRQMGQQSLARPASIHSPMHELIYEFMGIEAYSMELALNRERLMHLHDVLADDWLKRVEMVAASPAQYAVIEGNTDISIVSPERFETYYFPFIEKGCEILHGKGILAGAHLDANNRRLAPLIAGTSLDFIESFTPPPDCDMKLSDARSIWPDKTIQVHFPSSVHLFGVDKIREYAAIILKEAAPGNRITIGTMEDVPDRGRNTLVPMYRFFRENGHLPLETVQCL